MKKLEYLWVYHDSDNNEITLFKKLRSAKRYAETCWPQRTDFFEDHEETYPEWESNGDDGFIWGEYVTITKERINRD